MGKREILELPTVYCPRPSPGMEGKVPQRGGSGAYTRLPGLSAVSLPQTGLMTETYLEVKRNADHKMPENRQKGSDQVFL